MPRKSPRRTTHWKNPDEGMVVNYKRRIRRNRRRRRLMLFVLLSTTIAIIAFFAPFFKIARIDIIGVSERTGVDIQLVCDKLVGKNINFYSMDKISQIMEQFPYVKDAHVTRHFPNIVRVTIQESAVFAQSELADKNWYLIDSDGKILEIVPNEQPTTMKLLGVSEMPFLTGVPFSSDNVIFRNYTQVAQQIVNNGLHESVNWLDLSDSYNILFQLEGVTVQMGNNEKMDYKFNMLAEIRKELPSKVKGTLDLRDGSQAYFREIF